MNQDICQATTQWVAQLLQGKAEVAYSKFADADKACLIRATPADSVVRLYQSGGGIYRFSYEVVLKVRPRATQDRFDAIAVLRSIQHAIERREVPDCDIVFVSHKVTQLPNLLSVDTTGDEIYQMAATLTYLERPQ